MEELRVTDDAAYAQIHARIARHGDTAAASQSIQDKLDATKRIVDAVRAEGDTAVARFTEQFDRVPLAPDQFELTQALTAHIYLLVRSPDEVPRYVDHNSYVLGGKTVPAAGDGFYRRVLQTAIYLRNAEAFGL